jgi:hypothetical protein
MRRMTQTVMASLRTPRSIRFAVFYPIRHSRTRVATQPGRVGNPRDVLIFELKSDGLVDIVAVAPDLVPREVDVARIRRGLRPG